MQRLVIVILCIPVLLLSGCLNPAAVSVVSDMYEAALLENDELVATYFSEDYLEKHPLEELSDELAADVRNRGGVNLLNMKELQGRNLQSEIVQALNDTYAEDWSFVVLQTDDDTIQTWVVKRGETQYYIVEGQKMNVDTYNGAVLK
ncbi:hypothetical protein [Oceanobacillus polygoni]|uniref:Uncharacterized protein n=1 Tax=Oceanobacillus polygoni TaxID=1235259 RepID=A0A9X0YTV5_9BACI|nr:hypothetical protein [Oceanobacillus polygoni]MBP2077195.1 hypothetical protein [Oceanobacillus polygoni]